MGIKSGLAWHLKHQKLSEIDLSIVYDRHDLPQVSKTGYADNYSDYIGPRLEQAVREARTSGSKFYPTVRVTEAAPADSADCLPLQLTDLLLGSVGQAVVHGSSQVVKASLGLAAIHWSMDVSKSPWLQTLGMYRQLNLLAFPDGNGKVYDLADAMHEAPGDPELF
jgi:hypothetical protein